MLILKSTRETKRRLCGASSFSASISYRRGWPGSRYVPPKGGNVPLSVISNLEMSLNLVAGSLYKMCTDFLA